MDKPLWLNYFPMLLLVEFVLPLCTFCSFISVHFISFGVRARLQFCLWQYLDLLLLWRHGEICGNGLNRNIWKGKKKISVH